MNKSNLCVDAHTLKKEKTSVETWGVLLGFPLWLVLAGVFYVSGLYLEMGKLPFLKFYGSDPNILFIFITFPASVAFGIASAIEAIRLMKKSGNSEAIKVSTADFVDISLWLNLTFICAGIILHFTFYGICRAIPILGLAIGHVTGFLPPILLFPFLLDFFMPKFWKLVFGYNYGYFQGKLLKNLGRSWRKGDIQRDFRRHLLGAGILIFGILVVLAILALMGLLG
jgi:hypothetical protein